MASFFGASPKRVGQTEADDAEAGEETHPKVSGQRRQSIRPARDEIQPRMSRQDSVSSDSIDGNQEIRPERQCRSGSKAQQLNLNTSQLLTADDYKNAGNKLCSFHRYDEAIKYYDRAILENSEIPIFFSNRALCYLKLQQWNQAVQDCRRALELEPNLIKAHFFLGQALAEAGNLDDALRHLQRAHDLAKEKKLNFGDDIAYQIRLIKRNRWSKIEEEATKLEGELQSYLVELIKKDKENKLKELKDHDKSKDEVDEPKASSSSTQNTVEISDTKQHSEDEKRNVESKCDTYIEKVIAIFDNLRLQRKRREVPDFLCGKISFEIMQDPVITPSGITYDREDIEEHLKRVGHFDPITRQPLKANQLISNLAMKEVVDAYLNENEWALHY